MSKRFWLSWYHDAENMGAFELNWPWWCTGFDANDRETICAAVTAVDETAAKAGILASYDKSPNSIDWRFCEKRSDEWEPFSPRFPRAAWMQWP